MDNWKLVDENTPKNVEHVGFAFEWIDEDFNEDGTRIFFLTEDGICFSAKWCNEQDCWITDDETNALYYFEVPKFNISTHITKS